MKTLKEVCGTAKFKKIFFIFSFLAIPTINFLVFWVYVHFDSFVLAFKHSDGTSGLYLGNFKQIFEDIIYGNSGVDILEAFKNTILFYLASTLIVFPLSSLMAYFIYKKIDGYKIFRAIIYLPNIITSAALVALFKYTIGKGGPINAIYNSMQGTLTLENLFVIPTQSEDTAIWCLLFYSVTFGFGGNLVIFGGAMASINTEVLEAGELDGCNWFQELIYIIIPGIWPTLSTVLILGLVGIMGATGPVLAFTNGRFGTKTLSFLLYQLVAGVDGMPQNLEYAAALGLLMTAITFPIVLIAKKWLYSEKKEEGV